jgi:SRSO17 transposase
VYDGAVTRAEVEAWESDLQGLFVRLGPLFYRSESRGHAEQYVRGLLASLERKNGWTIAEHVGEPEPKALQRLLNLSPWDADAVLALNREYAMEHLADPAAVLVADPTGFPKKGTKSVGRWACSGSIPARWAGSITVRSPRSCAMSRRVETGS